MVKKVKIITKFLDEDNDEMTLYSDNTLAWTNSKFGPQPPNMRMMWKLEDMCLMWRNPNIEEDTWDPIMDYVGSRNAQDKVVHDILNYYADIEIEETLRGEDE